MALLKIKYKVRAFSLMEVLVSFVILLLIFFIAIQFFANINLSGFDVQKMNAANTLDAYIYQTHKSSDFSLSRDTLNGWQVSREAVPYEDADSLVQMTFTVYKKDSAATPFLSRTLLMDLKTRESSRINDVAIEP